MEKLINLACRLKIAPVSVKKSVPRITSREQLGSMTKAAGYVVLFKVIRDVQVR